MINNLIGNELDVRIFEERIHNDETAHLDGGLIRIKL
jgi:hypothetical protein